MENVKKIIYYTITTKDNCLYKETKKRKPEETFKFEYCKIKFTLFKNKKNKQGLFNYFLVGKYPNEKSKNYYLAQFDLKKEQINNFSKDFIKYLKKNKFTLSRYINNINTLYNIKLKEKQCLNK